MILPREASWTAAVLCRFPTARPKAPEDLRSPKAVAPSPRLLAAQRADAAADTLVLEQEIDTRVYRLHALTPHELKLVEGTSK